MKIKAAVLYEPNKPMVVETIDLEAPKEGEVLVRIVAAGVCYSDYHIMLGELPSFWLPALSDPCPWTWVRNSDGVSA